MYMEDRHMKLNKVRRQGYQNKNEMYKLGDMHIMRYDEVCKLKDQRIKQKDELCKVEDRHIKQKDEVKTGKASKMMKHAR